MRKFSEPVFGVNDFNEPKVLKDYDAIAVSVLLILFGKPGCYPSIPQLGMNIQQYLYSFYDELDVDSIRASLVYQCTLLSSTIDSNNIVVGKQIVDDNPLLIIQIPINYRRDQNQLVIGVTTNSNGSVSYNYKIMANKFADNLNL